MIHYFLLPFLIQIHITEDAESHYEKRASGKGDAHPSAFHINKAVNLFSKSYDETPTAAAAEGFLKSMEYKGTRLELSEDERVSVYEEAIRFAEEEALQRFPDHAGIHYWYMTNLARWAREKGPYQAASENIPKKLRQTAQTVIRLDHKYQEAGAYRVLGIMHLKVPYIPFVLEWPSKEKAREYLQKAHNLGKDNPANQLFYAESLIDGGRKKKGMRLLRRLVQEKPREAFYFEDKESLEMAIKILNKYDR